jgi:glycosyltransferase involved in cell wall biosynthesis
MKIAVLGTRGFPNIQGGIESHCESLYPSLAGRGCEVIVFTRRPYVDPVCDSYKGVRLVPLPCLKNKYLEAFFHSLFGIFAARRLSPDILHVHGIGPSLVIPIARLLRLKVVMTNHGPDYERKKWGKFAKFILVLGEYLGTRFANGIICISESIADRVSRKYSRDVAVIPNGAALAQISKNSSVIKKYGLTRGKYILSVGRFVPEKGFHDLIEAFDHIEEWKLVIVGEADHPDRYSLNLREKATKNKNIVLTGSLTGESLCQLYSHAGLFVLPSYYEGLPIVLLEAMSYSLPCIASDIPANRDLELDNDRFFKAGDIQALSAKIKQFIGVPLTFKERRSQTKKIAERYDWNKIADNTLKVYKQALNHTSWDQ